MIDWTVFILECAGAIVIFTCAILIPVCKNPVWWIEDYPKDIQEKYFETHERIPAKLTSKPVVIKKSIAVLFFLVLLVGLAWLAGARTFLSGFLVSYVLWLVVTWYDCFILDWLIFANLKQVRLPGTEHMDAAYHQKKYHFIQSCIGTALGLLPCLLCGLIILLLAR